VNPKVTSFFSNHGLPFIVFCAIAVVILYRCTLPHLEIRFYSEKSGQIEIYYDVGQGISEEFTFRTKVTASNRVQKEQFPFTHDSLGLLRLDPNFASNEFRLERLSLIRCFGLLREQIPLNSLDPNHEVELRVDTETESIFLKTVESFVDPYVWIMLDTPIQVFQMSDKFAYYGALLGAIAMIVAIFALLIRRIQIQGSPFLVGIRGLTFSARNLGVFILLASYVALPYLMMGSGSGFQLLESLVFCILGSLWILAIGNLQRTYTISIRFHRFLLLGLALFSLLTHASMNHSILWKGDEHYHATSIKFLSEIVSKQAELPWLIGIFGLSGIWMSMVSNKSSWLWRGIVLILAILIGSSLINESGLENYLVRYPSLVKWIFLGPFLIEQTIHSEFSEWSLRVIPWLITGAVIVFIFHRFRSSQFGNTAIITLLCLTTPTFLYYSSVLYPEPITVFLLLIGIARLSDIDKPLDELMTSPLWFSLVFIGFIKETILPLILAFVCLRYLTVFLKERSLRSLIRLEHFRTGIAVLFPLFFYVFIRKLHGDPRGYSPNWEHLIDWQLYFMWIRDTFSQFAGTLIAAITGVMVLICKNRWKEALLGVACAGSIIVFFHMDYRVNVGYSRFNYLILPLLLIWSAYGIKALCEFKPQLGIAFGITLIIANSLTYPFHFDGSRRADWSLNLMDLYEQSYPFKEAFEMMSMEPNNTSLDIIYLGYGYCPDLYLGKGQGSNLEYREFVSLEDYRAKENAHLNRNRIILSQEKLPGDFARKDYQIIQNAAHKLYLYRPL
jgi:hypothetical protein